MGISTAWHSLLVRPAATILDLYLGRIQEDASMNKILGRVTWKEMPIVYPIFSLASRQPKLLPSASSTNTPMISYV